MNDGLDVNETSNNITWFHLNYDMSSRRIYELSLFGGHFVTLRAGPSSNRLKQWIDYAPLNLTNFDVRFLHNVYDVSNSN